MRIRGRGADGCIQRRSRPRDRRRIRDGGRGGLGQGAEIHVGRERSAGRRGRAATRHEHIARARSRDAPGRNSGRRDGVHDSERRRRKTCAPLNSARRRCNAQPRSRAKSPPSRRTSTAQARRTRRNAPGSPEADATPAAPAALVRLEEAAKALGALRLAHRSATLGKVATGELTADEAIARVDAVTRLEALARHAWRSAAYLVGRGE